MDDWQSMKTAPRDGTVILVCELVPSGDCGGQVLPAAYMRANGNPKLEGFWGCWTTSQVPIHLMNEFPNDEGFAVGWRKIALTPLCWKPLPKPETYAKLRRRQGQILRHKFST